MKRFVWRLQRVLDIKTKQEQIKRSQLLVITERLIKVRRRLLAEKGKLLKVLTEIAGQEGGRRLSEQEFCLKCSTTNNEIIRELTEKAKGLELEKKEKIAEVLKARRFKEGLEKLREKAKEEFIREQEKLEQKQMDEQATSRYARKVICID
jgi:flagellar biosynthesis chaperone FliJ